MRNYVVFLVLVFGLVAMCCKKKAGAVPQVPVAPPTTCVGAVCASGVVVR